MNVNVLGVFLYGIVGLFEIVFFFVVFYFDLSFKVFWGIEKYKVI